VTRTFLVNAAEIGTYDGVKDYIRRENLLPDGLPTHLAASTAAGICSAIVSTPVDVVKTRMMNSAGQGQQYSGMFDGLRRLAVEEGFSAMYRGFAPIVVRKTAYCLAFFVTYENCLINLKEFGH